MTACQDPECARLRDEALNALSRATAELLVRRDLATLGGLPPPITHDSTPEGDPP